MKAAACAAAVFVVALAGGCNSKSSAGFQHPRVLKGAIERADEKRLVLKTGMSVDFVSADRGFLATGGDRLLRTTDGGRTWAPAGKRPRLLAEMDFVTPRTGLALTTSNALLVTHDGAKSWRRFRVFRKGGLEHPGWGLDFIDEQHGWVLPSVGPMYRTSDGGRSWVSLRLPCKEFESPIGPTFVDEQHGYLACAGQPGAGSQSKSLYATADGGETWKLRVGPPGPWGGYAREIVFRDSDSGLFVSDRGGLSASHDGGRSVRMVLNTDDEDSISDVAWPTGQRMFAVTFHAGVLRSDDGGSHWQRVFPAGDAPPSGPVAFASKSEGIGFGAETISGGPSAEFGTRDGGRTWTRVRLDPPLPLADQVFRFRRTILAGNGGGLTRSDDAGAHWRTVFALPRSQSAWLSFISPDVGYRAEGNRLYRTDDGGSTWTFVARGAGDLYGVTFMSQKDAFVVDPGEPPPNDGKKHMTPIVNRLLESHDGGKHWDTVEEPLMGSVFAMHRLDDEHWWLLASVPCARVPNICGSQIWRTTDAGAHWDLIEFPKELYFGSVSFVSPSVGFAGSPGSGLYRTSDGGVTWSYVYSG